MDVKLLHPETLASEKIFAGERRVLFNPLNLHCLIVLLFCSSVKYAKNKSSDRAGTSKLRLEKKKISYHSVCREIKNLKVFFNRGSVAYTCTYIYHERKNVLFAHLKVVLA